MIRIKKLLKIIIILYKKKSPEAKQGIKSQELSNVDGKTGGRFCLRSNARHRTSSKKQEKSGKTDQKEPKIDSNKKETDRLSIFVDDEFIQEEKHEKSNKKQNNLANSI